MHGGGCGVSCGWWALGLPIPILGGFGGQFGALSGVFAPFGLVLPQVGLLGWLLMAFVCLGAMHMSGMPPATIELGFTKW